MNFSLFFYLSTQAAVVFSEVITDFTEDSSGSNTFSSGTITTADGASFNLRVTASAGASYGTDLGILGGLSGQINNGETLSVSGITVTNFTAGSLTLAVADVTNLGFSSLELTASSNGNDSGTITLGGATPIAWSEFDVAQVPAITGHDAANRTLDIVSNQSALVSSFSLADTSTSRGHFLGAVTIQGMTPSAIPEPTSAALLGLGGLTLLSRRTRK